MEKVGWISRRPDKQPGSRFIAHVAGCLGIAGLLMMAGTAVAQNPTPTGEVATPAQMTTPEGYTGHHTVDLGGRMTNLSGSDAMYATLVNMRSGPRVLGESFEMRALPNKKDGFVDHLKAFGSGFGGDPYIFAKLDASKGKSYVFSGLFRRDRQYSDYDLLGNPNIATGRSIPIGPSNAPTGSVAWPQVMHSSMMFNTVRRMTDTNLTIFPLATLSYRVGYSRNTFEGPSLSPSYSIFKYDALLQQYQLHASDDYLAAVDWKPVEGTTLTVEEQWNHYKNDSYYTLDPNGFMVQESDGRKAYLGNWDSQTAYGIGACNTNSMGTGYTSSTVYTILSPAQTSGGLPVINPACAVVTSYTRRQPTSITTPTTIFRFQSSSLKNVTMNGNIRYTQGTMRMPNYYEDVQGLNGNLREQTYVGGYGRAHRAVVAADYGINWKANDTVTLSDQVSYSDARQPGYSNIPAPLTLGTPKTAGNQTINYSGPLTPGTGTLPHGIDGVLKYGYFGQMFFNNNLTVSWDPNAKTALSLTYRYGSHKIGQGVPHVGRVDQSQDPYAGEVDITENGGIFRGAYRVTSNWNINGSVEALFYDNVLTPVAPRQSYQYRIRTQYKPKQWATLTGAFNDRERHNNTNNNAADVAAGDVTYYGPIKHEDHNRVASFGAVLAPNETIALDLNYAYSSVYTATNICFASGAAAGLPGAATLTANGAPNVCPGIFARGSTTQLVDFYARDFEDAPTQSGSFALMVKPTDAVHADFGYRISSVNGTRLYSDARDVAGTLMSKYQTPFFKVAWTIHPGLIWNAEYNYYRYSEDGPSGAQYCSLTVSTTASVVPCASLTQYPTGLTEGKSGLTAPREFRANNVTLGIHYEF